MLRLVRNIINIVIALILVLATGGFAVFQHFCSCEKVSISSVITEAVCSHDEAPQEPCCQQQDAVKDSCRTLMANSSKEGSFHHHHNCCSTSVSFFKTSEFSNPGKQEIKVFALSGPADFQTVPVTWNIQDDDLVIFDDTSPPFTAVKLFLQFHQLKAIPDVA